MKRFCKTSRNPKGFTLVELIVVIAIIGILASVVSVSIIAITRNARTKAAKTSLENYWRITALYFSQINMCYGGSEPNEKHLKTRLPNNILQSGGLSDKPCSSLSDGKIYIQYEKDPKSAKNKYTIQKITLRQNNKYYYTTTGTSVTGPKDKL